MLVEDDGPGRGPRRPAGADAREHRARPRAPRLVPGAARAGRDAAGCRARTPTPSSSATPCGRPTSGCRCTSLLATDPAVAQKLPLAELDACFDDAALLRHVPEVIARLDRSRLERSRRVPARLRSFVRAGKVRDLYRVGDDRLLLVASDRLSAFDVVLPTPIPDKGRVLTGLSRFWFAADGRRSSPTTCSRPTRRTSPPRSPTATRTSSTTLRGRMMIGRLAEVLPIECVVRGYLSGSGWKEYLDDGAVCGIPLPAGPARERPAARRRSSRPRTKAPAGRARREHPVRAASRR